MSRRPPTRRLCTEPDCTRVVKGRGLCSRHYQAWRTSRTPSLKDPGCAVGGCQGRHHARGWCSLHYQRWRATGDPEAVQGRYRHRSRPRGPRLPASVLVTTRLPPPLAARAEYEAARRGITRAAYLRALVEQDTAAVTPPLRLVQ